MEMVDVKKSKNFKEKISCLIDYYVLQYGEKYRDLITRRFNDIVFCIYQSNDFYTYLEMNYNRLISLYAIRYLNELGIDKAKLNGSFIQVNNTEEVKRLLNATFGCINSNVIYLSAFEEYKEKKEEDISLEDITFIEQLTEKTINEVLSISNKYIKQIEELNIEYNMRLAYSKISGYKNKFKTDFKKYLLNDFDIDKLLHRERIIDVLQRYGVLGTSYLELCKDGKYVPTVYIAPFSKMYQDYDVILDHEIRHAIEMSLDDNFRLKSGLSYSTNHIDKLCNYKYRTINEIMTQKMSIESTRKRHEDGILLFSTRNLTPEIRTTGYDKNITIFDSLVDESLYRDLVEARINKSYSKSLEKKIAQIDEILSKEKGKILTKK